MTHALISIGVTVVVGLGTVLGGSWVVTRAFRAVDALSARRPHRLASGPRVDGGEGDAADEGATDRVVSTDGDPATDGAAPGSSDSGDLMSAGAQLRGGMAIGVLERLAIFASVLANYPTGIALVLAVKGLARYPELKAQHTGSAERFVIGTFVSVLVAVGGAGCAVWLSGWLNARIG